MTRKEKPLSRGDIITINFDPQAGSEITKRRPAIVISPRIYNEKSKTIICCPITSKIKEHNVWHVKLPSNLQVKGAIVSDQIKSMDWRARKAYKIEIAPEEVVEEVLARIETLVS